jgi:type I restriction enzyme S subunit
MARLGRQKVKGKFPKEWDVVDTADLLSDGKESIKIGPFGSQLKKEILVSEGYKVYGQENVYENDYSIGNRFVSKDKFEQLRSCEIKSEDILVTMMGTIGSIGIVPSNIEVGIMDSHLLRLRIDKNKFDNKFVLYSLKSDFIQKQIQNLSVGCIMDGLSSSIIKQLIFLKPGLTEQQKIASVLSTLDSKIELNNRINAELEAMAKTLYDYWFVQFDFPDKKGKPYKSSGGKMVWNEELKREIPEGWNPGTLSDIAKITMGQSPPGESYNVAGDGIVFYQGCTDFGNRFPSIRQYTTAPTRHAKPGDILLSVRAPVGTLNIAKEDCCIGRGLAALNSKSNCQAYLFEVLRNMKQIFDRRNVDGTTFGAITKDDLFSLPVAIPSEFILSKYQEITNPLFERQNIIEWENIKLAELRDWLLPMLMNGQVKVT